MDADSDLNSIRTNLRSSNKNYDQYAFPFLESYLDTENIEQIVNIFPFFSEEIQIKVVNQIFSTISLSCKNIGEEHFQELFFFMLEIIQIFDYNDYYKMIDFAQPVLQLLDQSFDLKLSKEIQQKLLDVLSEFIYKYSELKNSDFYEKIQDLIHKFNSTLNLLPLFTSLIINPPFPPDQFVDFLVTTIYDNEYEKKYTRKTFKFFKACMKNNIKVNYHPFLQQIQSYEPFLQQIQKSKKLCSSFFDFLITCPFECPDIINFLLQFEDNTTKPKLKIKIFQLFLNPKYFNIWKKTNDEQIIQCAVKNLESDHSYLRALAIIAFIFYQEIQDIKYSDDLAQLMIDNFENPILTFPISKLILHWICDISMTSDVKEQVYDMVLNEYENLKVVINLNLDDPINNQHYFYFESLIDKIYNTMIETK